jgi:hypothetical protein
MNDFSARGLLTFHALVEVKVCFDAMVTDPAVLVVVGLDFLTPVPSPHLSRHTSDHIKQQIVCLDDHSHVSLCVYVCVTRAYFSLRYVRTFNFSNFLVVPLDAASNSLVAQLPFFCCSYTFACLVHGCNSWGA